MWHHSDAISTPQELPQSPHVTRVTSPTHALVKRIRRIQSKRLKRDAVLLEGIKLVKAVRSSGVRVEQVLISRSFSKRAAGIELLHAFRSDGVPCAELRDDLFRKLSSLEHPEGILALARRDFVSIAKLALGLVVVPIGIQDPGNLGAIARVAEAVGAAGIVVPQGGADPLGPKALRGSMGSLLRLPVVEGRSALEALHGLRERDFLLAATVSRGGADYREVDLSPPIGLVLGRESSGLPKPLLDLCDVKISLPMKETVESLNVASVAAIVLYHARFGVRR